MSKLLLSVVVVLLTAGFAMSEPALFTVEPATKGVRVRFADFDGTAEKVGYDETSGKLTLSGSVDLTQRGRLGTPRLLRASTLVYSFRDENFILTGAAVIGGDLHLKAQ